MALFPCRCDHPQKEKTMTSKAHLVGHAARLVGALCTLVLPLAAGAQGKRQLRPEDPFSARSVTVMALSTLPVGQRAVVYVRKNEFPGILVVIRRGTGTAEDLAAGYKTARRMVDPRTGLKGKMQGSGATARAYVDASQVRPLRGAEQASFALYLKDLSQVAEFTIDGIGTGPLLRIAMPKGAGAAPVQVQAPPAQ
jgi:hypothetical protein